MRIATPRLCVLLFLMIVAPVDRSIAADTAPRPNIIFILTDDLGYGDIGAFFQNLRRTKNDPAAPWHMTPHLDALAGQGMQMRDSYCPAPVCAPSRSSLLTGVTQGHAEVRDNQFDKALADNHTIASVLRGAGYATAAFGKWGLQGGTRGEIDDARHWPAHPLKRGFDDYYGYIRHVDGHFHYPHEDQREVYDGYTNVSDKLKLCYTTDLFAARAKKWIIDQHKARADQPFFVYLAFDTPHAKLQNPPCAFPQGGGLRGGLQWLGEPGRMINTAAGVYDRYEHPDYAGAMWDDDNDPATPQRPWPDVYRRYATSVRRIDDAVGDLMTLLADLDLDENTLVIFTSDNGPSVESYLKGKDADGYPTNYAPTFFDSYGPFDGIKRDCWEGGVRMPTIARWPGRVAAGAIDHTPCGAWDWLATFADLAGAPIPARTDGVSLKPTLLGSGQQTPSTVYIEYFNNSKTPGFDTFEPAHRNRKRGQMQLVRRGDFVGVRYDVKSADDDFEIYNVAEDPSEAKNLAEGGSMGDLQRQFKAMALQSRMPNDSAKRPYDDAPIPAVNIAGARGVTLRQYDGDWKWLPKFETMQPGAKSLATNIPTHITDAPIEPNGAMYTGYINIPAEGEYTFAITSDGPSFLRIHDCAVIDADFGHAAGVTVEGRIKLAKGLHPFRLYYAKESGKKAPPQLKFEWSGPGIDRQVVPAAAMMSDGQ